MRTYSFLFFSLIICFNVSFAQKSDSLSVKSLDEIRTLTANNIRSNPKASIIYANYLLDSAKKTNDYNNECLAYNLLGTANRVLGNLDLALENQIIAENLLTKIDNIDLTVAVYTALGNTYSDLGTYDKVLPNYYKAIEIAKKNTLELNVMALNHNLAYFKDQIGEYNEALKILKENRILISKNEDSLDAKLKFLSKNNFLQAMVLTKLNQPDSVIHYAEKGIEANNLLNDDFSKQGAYSFLGIAYTQKRNFKTALTYLNKADSLGVLMGNNITLLDNKYALASLYFKMKDYDEVINILEKSIALTERDNLNYATNDDNYKLLAEAYKEKGDYEKANFYFEGYLKKYNANKELHHIIDNSFEEKKIEEFKENLKTLQLEKKKKQDHLNYLGLGAIIVILALLLLLLKFYNKKKKNDIKFQELLSKVNSGAVKQTIVDTKDVVLEESETNDVSDTIKQQILENLKKLEAQEYYLNKECTSHNVAKKIKTNTTYLSKVINTHYQKNFSTYINDLRINYAILRLKNDTRFRSFSVQSIAEELGYKSADSFTKYFKQHTGLNPSFYIKQLNDLK